MLHSVKLIYQKLTMTGWIYLDDWCAKHMNDCSAVTKVHRAQDLGAAGVVFASDACYAFGKPMKQ